MWFTTDSCSEGMVMDNELKAIKIISEWCSKSSCVDCLARTKFKECKFNCLFPEQYFKYVKVKDNLELSDALYHIAEECYSTRACYNCKWWKEANCILNDTPPKDWIKAIND